MIADFGLSRAMEDHLLTEVCGTPGVSSVLCVTKPAVAYTPHSTWRLRFSRKVSPKSDYIALD